MKQRKEHVAIKFVEYEVQNLESLNYQKYEKLVPRTPLHSPSSTLFNFFPNTPLTITDDVPINLSHALQ